MKAMSKTRGNHAELLIDGVMYYTAEHLTEYDLISANTADGSVLRIDVICM